MSEFVLVLQDFGVGFGEKIILSSVNLEIPDRGIFLLMGPAGTGKSTLLRTITGINDANPSLRTWGAATYAGVPLSQSELPVLVAQNTKLLLANVLDNVIHDLPERRSLTKIQQINIGKRLLIRSGLRELSDELEKSVVDLPLHLQRHLAIARSAAANPKLLLIDEPTTGIEEQHCKSLIKYIKQESERRAVLVVVHNQKHANLFKGKMALLAGGWVHESKDTLRFLSHPESDAGRCFVQTGSCDVPSPSAKPEELSDEAINKYNPPPLCEAAQQYVSDAFGPRNFLWLKKGRLAGTPKPGLLTDINHDLKALKRVGVTVLVTLTESPMEKEILEEYQICNVFFPIDDMGAPNIEDAKKLCYRISRMLQKGEVVAMHCKAGLGRTGTMLAAMLVWDGLSALEALESTRRIEPRWVQSEDQIAFLEDFADSIGTDRGSSAKVSVCV